MISNCQPKVSNESDGIGNEAIAFAFPTNEQILYNYIQYTLKLIVRSKIYQLGMNM